MKAPFFYVLLFALIILVPCVVAVSISTQTISYDGLNNSASNFTTTITGTNILRNYSYWSNPFKQVLMSVPFDTNFTTDSTIDISTNAITAQYVASKVFWNTDGLFSSAWNSVIEQCINTSTSYNLSGSYYVRAIIYINETVLAGANIYFVSKSETTGNQRSWWLGYAQSSGNVSFVTSPDGTTTTDKPQYAISTRKWYDIVGVHGPSNNLLYINGTLVTTYVRVSNTTFASNIPIVIGGSLAASLCSNSRNKSMDLVEIGLYEPTATQIAEWYATYTGARQTRLMSTELANWQNWTANTAAANNSLYSIMRTNFTIGDGSTAGSASPTFTQELQAVSIFVNQTVGVQANCTDADNASLIWSINSTLFTINQTGYFNDSSHTNVSIGNWSVRVNCSDGALSAISDFSYEIKNTTNTPPPPENSIPTISVDVRPNSATNETDLYCYVTVTDADNATTLVEYNWYNGTTLYGGEIDLLVTTGIETLMNITRYANLGVGDVWNCTAYAWDGINASAWASDTVTIAEPSILGEGAFMGYAAIAILMGAVLYVLLKIGLNLVDEHFPLKIFLIWVSVLLLIPLSQLAIHMMSSMDSTIISMLTILQYAITIVGIMTTLYMMIKMLQYYLSTFGKKTKNPLRT